jgi:TolA-binding protein
MEPPDWLLPTRHTLGAVLVSAKRFEEAEKVYREDLAAWPENGWSLFGLAQCLEALDRKEEAAAVRKRFDSVWSRADTKLTSTCLCVD